MTECARNCAHRAFVYDYHIARHAQLLEEERVTIGDPEMITDRRKTIRPVVFKEWLTGHARGR